MSFKSLMFIVITWLSVAALFKFLGFQLRRLIQGGAL